MLPSICNGTLNSAIQSLMKKMKFWRRKFKPQKVNLCAEIKVTLEALCLMETKM